MGNHEERLETVYLNHGWQTVPASRAKAIKIVRLRKRIAELQSRLDFLLGAEKQVGKKFEW